MRYESSLYTSANTEYSLNHHGVLGMKWGIRRYQPYPDGKRVKGGKEVGKAAEAKTKSQTKKKVTFEEISKMSDAELRTKINRLRLEDDYMNLMKKRYKDLYVSEKVTKSVLEYVKKFGKDTVHGIAKMASNKTAKTIFDYLLKLIF